MRSTRLVKVLAVLFAAGALAACCENEKCIKAPPCPRCGAAPAK